MQFLSKNFSMAVTVSVRSSRLLCCKIVVLKYLRRTSTLRKIFSTKIFLAKIPYNENFPIYSTDFTDFLAQYEAVHTWNFQIFCTEYLKQC